MNERESRAFDLLLILVEIGLSIMAIIAASTLLSAQATPATADVRPVGVQRGTIPTPATHPHLFSARIGATTTWHYINDSSPARDAFVVFHATLHYQRRGHIINGPSGPLRSHFAPDGILSALSYHGRYPFDATWRWRIAAVGSTLPLRVTLPLHQELIGIRWYYEGWLWYGFPAFPPQVRPDQVLGPWGMIECRR